MGGSHRDRYFRIFRTKCRSFDLLKTRLQPRQKNRVMNVKPVAYLRNVYRSRVVVINTVYHDSFSYTQGYKPSRTRYESTEASCRWSARWFCSRTAYLRVADSGPDAQIEGNTRTLFSCRRIPHAPGETPQGTLLCWFIPVVVPGPIH